MALSGPVETFLPTTSAHPLYIKENIFPASDPDNKRIFDLVKSTTKAFSLTEVKRY